jgi:hypothetical protein
MRVNTRTTSLYSSQSKLALSVKGCLHELGEVDRAEQAGPVRRQRLLAAGIGGADGLAPPVVVHLVDAIDQDETRLGVVVRRDHDHVPQVAGADLAVDLAGHQAVVAGDVALVGGPLAPDHLLGIGQVDLVGFLLGHREHQRPVAVVLDRVHEAIGDQQLRLNWRRRPSSRLARMKSLTSGWAISKVPICAPRRPPAELTVKHILS